MLTKPAAAAADTCSNAVAGSIPTMSATTAMSTEAPNTDAAVRRCCAVGGSAATRFLMSAISPDGNEANATRSASPETSRPTSSTNSRTNSGFPPVRSHTSAATDSAISWPLWVASHVRTSGAPNGPSAMSATRSRVSSAANATASALASAAGGCIASTTSTRCGAALRRGARGRATCHRLPTARHRAR